MALPFDFCSGLSSVAKQAHAFPSQIPPGFDYRVPVHTIKFRIEVFGFDKAAHLVENGFPVAAAETSHRWLPAYPSLPPRSV